MRGEQPVQGPAHGEAPRSASAHLGQGPGHSRFLIHYVKEVNHHGQVIYGHSRVHGCLRRQKHGPSITSCPAVVLLLCTCTEVHGGVTARRGFSCPSHHAPKARTLLKPVEGLPSMHSGQVHRDQRAMKRKRSPWLPPIYVWTCRASRTGPGPSLVSASPSLPTTVAPAPLSGLDPVRRTSSSGQ